MVIRVLAAKGLPDSPGGVHHEERASGCLPGCLAGIGAVVILVLVIGLVLVRTSPFGRHAATQSAHPGRNSPSVSRAEAAAARRDAAELAALTVAADGAPDGEDSVRDTCLPALPADHDHRAGLIDCTRHTRRSLRITGDPHAASVAVDRVLRSRGWHLREEPPAAGAGLPTGVAFGELSGTGAQQVRLGADWLTDPLRLSVSVDDPYWHGVPADT